MVRKPLLGLFLTAIAGLMLVVACTPPAQPASAPTKPAAAPTKAPEPTKPAGTAAAPTAVPTAAAAPAPTKPASAPAAVPPPPKDWPNKPIQLIVPWPAGGGGDATMRLLGNYMEKPLGQTVQIVNKAGAGSQTGLTELSLAKPDGYTIGYLNTPSAATTYLDPERKAVYNGDSFAMIGYHSPDPELFVVLAESKYKTLKDLVDDAKAKPNQVKIASSGPLGDDHIALMLFDQLAGTTLAPVQFEGGAAQLSAVLGGHVDAGMMNVGAGLVDLFKSGKVRILAIFDDQRSTFYPGVPTAKELGYNLSISADKAIAAPKGTSSGIVWALSRAMEEALKNPEHIAKAQSMAMAFRYMNADDTTKWWKDYEARVKPLIALAYRQ